MILGTEPIDLLKRAEIPIITIKHHATIDLYCQDIYSHTWCTYTPFSADRGLY